jgi:hypothetical protein
MGKQDGSLVRHLTRTAWESWSTEAHFRNATIVALVGSIAFSMATPKPQRSSPLYMQETQVTNSGSKKAENKPLQLVPTISMEEIEVKEIGPAEPDDPFGKSFGGD